ncbi:unnamed protein product, partial [Prorocentrum cordatum]
MLDAVAYLHKHHIGHRDVSLENAVLTKAGVLQIIDFGVSVRSHSFSGVPFRYFRRVGKECYRAPECYVPDVEEVVNVLCPAKALPGDVGMVRLPGDLMVEVRLPDTVDGLVVEHPLATWRMCADDLSIRQRGAQQWVADVFPLAIDDSFASFAELGLEFSVGAKGKGAAKSGKRFAKMRRRTARGNMNVLIGNAQGQRRAAAIMYINDLDYVDRVEVLNPCRYERGAVQQVLRRLLGDRLRRVPDDGERQLEAGIGYHNIGSLGELLDLFVQAGRHLAISEERVSGRRRDLSERDDLQEQLQRAWKQQQIAAGMQPQWGRVKGPAGAVVMSMRRAGWTWPKWHVFLMRNGEQLNRMETCPNDVGMLLQQDLEAQLWAQWTAEPGHESLAPAPFLQPARAVLGVRNFPKHAVNAAREVLISGSWTMGKLCKRNIAPTGICLACGEGAGTPRRRYFVCPELRAVRNKGQADWQRAVEQQVHSLLWARGLVRDPSVDWQFRTVTEEQYHFVVNEGPEAHLTGDIVCDGSKMGGSKWAQAGWAAMAINGEGAPTIQLWGPLPCQCSVQTTVKRAEMWAFLKVLEVVMPPCRIYTDHQGIVDGLARGANWCLSWKRPRADLWRRIWHMVADIGLGRGCVGHVEARRSKAAINRLEEGQQAIARGNAAVDLLAKCGAEDDCGCGRQEVLDRLGEKAKWAIQSVGWWHQQLNGESEVQLMKQSLVSQLYWNQYSEGGVVDYGEAEKEALLTAPCALGEARRRRGGAAAIFDRLPCCAEGAKLQERLQLVEQRVDRAGAELTRAARAGEFEVRQLRAEVLHLQRRLAAEGLGGGPARAGGQGSQRAGGGAEFRDLVAQVAAQRAEIDEARRRAAQASQRGAGLRARLEERRRSHAQEVEELTRVFK